MAECGAVSIEFGPDAVNFSPGGPSQSTSERDIPRSTPNLDSTRATASMREPHHRRKIAEH